MTKKLQKMAVAAAAILGVGATAVKSAEAASVTLNFYQGFTRVGVGSFSYDELTPYEAIFFPSSRFGRPVEIKRTDNLFVVKNLAITLLGVSWRSSNVAADRSGFNLSPLLWAPSGQNQLKVVKGTAPPPFGSGAPSLWGNWAFGNLRSPTPSSPFMEISGNSDGPGSIMGWRQDSFLNGSFGPRSGFLTAYPTAGLAPAAAGIAEEVGPGGENPEPVPEPATTAGLALAAAGLGYAKKKFGASKV